MARRAEVVFAADLPLQLLNLGGEELDRRAAVGTHHVVMVTAIVLVLVAGDTVMKRDLAGQPAFREELQGSVDGRETYLRVFLFDKSV